MAIYHLSMKIISRGNGQNAVASAAYRSGEELTDEQDGTTKFYGRSVEPETYIIAPDQAPSWVYNRQKLWNTVERSENRVNSRLARELEIALPLELSNEQQTTLIKEFIQENCVDKGMIADVCIHRDHPENPHAHIMLTTREINKQGFGEKNRSWNQTEYLEHTRKRWAEVCNRHLEKTDSLERIDHRSYKDQGLDLIPTEHEGVKGKLARRLGQENEDRIIQRNNVAKAYNEKVISLQEKRDQLLNEGLSEKTKKPSDLVITYRMYMTNQRELRIAYNKINFYETKLKKEGTLSLFERENLSKARKEVREIGSRKFDYIDHVNQFLKGENSLYVRFATDYGNAQARKIEKQLKDSGKELDASTRKYIERSATRFSEEMRIRFADTIRQLGTSDFKTVVPYVEKQLHTNTAKRLLNGWVSHESVTLEVRKLREQLEDYKQSGITTADKNTVRLINNIATLEHVKQFYEEQAFDTLKSKGFGELVDKYNTEKQQSAIVAMYDELIRHPEISSDRALETRTFNNFKLRKVQNIVRGELSGMNIQKRLDSLEQWKTIQEKQIDKLLKQEQTAPIMEELTKKQLSLKDTRQSIQLIHEGKRILNARTSDYLAKHSELRLKLNGIQLSKDIPIKDFKDFRMDFNFKKEANYHLFIDPDPTCDQRELLTKMYDNVLDYKEYQVEKESKNVLYRQEYSSYRAILGNLDEAIRQREELKEGLSQAQDRVKNHTATLEQFEAKWTTKKELEARSFVLGKATKLNEINDWLAENNISAKTRSGALNQLKYQYNQATYHVTKHQELDQVKIPALQNMKYITENKAIRTVEKDFNLQAGFQYRIPLSEQKKELFVAYAETKKNLGVDHLDTQKYEKQLGVFTEQYKQAKDTLKSTQEIIQEKQEALNHFERSTGRRLSQFEEALGNQPPEALGKAREQISNLKTFRKTELKRMETQVQALKNQEQAQREQANQKAQAIGLAKNFKNALTSYKSQVSEAEMNLARKQRLKALEKDRGMELTLERER